MQFRIWKRSYLVRRRWNLTHEGQRKNGLCVNAPRTIWLDGDLSEADIESVLRHEHAHAWAFEVGDPVDPESVANFAGIVGEAFEADYEQQGGLKALLEVPIEGLRPGGGSNRPARPLGNRSTVTCGRCCTDLGSGTVQREAARITALGPRVASGFQCPICDSVQVWDESATEQGEPTGEYHNARLLGGADATAWLEAHRELHSPYNVA